MFETLQMPNMISCLIHLTTYNTNQRKNHPAGKALLLCRHLLSVPPALRDTIIGWQVHIPQNSQQ